MGFLTPEGTLYINDPQLVSEFYVQLDKVVDKSEKFQRIGQDLFGNSILLHPADESWALRRKHMSAAFSKEKLNNILGLVSDYCTQSIRTLIATHVKEGRTIDIVQYLRQLETDNILKSVFGKAGCEMDEQPYVENGVTRLIHPGEHLTNVNRKQIMRIYKPQRMFFDCFDTTVLG